VSGSRSESLAVELTATLLAARNPDGGWPYYKGKTSRLEPTCAALLALRLEPAPLDRWPRRNGLFGDGGNEISIGFNGLAGVVLADDPNRPIARALTAALTESRGVRIPPSGGNRQDDAIQGWPWVEGTFSWVEPTCWCMLALKRLTGRPRPPQVLRRLHDGERLLADRACLDGGWNYGNSNMLGTELRPYVPTTALALLSLRDVGEPPHVKQGLRYLEAHQQTETGGLALSLACICLAVCDRPHAAAREAMMSEWRHARFLDNLHVTALALYAATAEQHQCGAFRV